MKDTLVPGITHTMTYLVDEKRTVPYILPERADFAAMPHVFATGFMTAVIEAACIEALAPHIDDDEVTLGTHVNFSHQAPTVPGSTVTVDVTLEEVNGRALLFSITARDEYAVISTGTHQRGLVNRERFLSKLPTRKS